VVTEHRIASSGVELAAVEAGDREQPTILLLHGYPDTKELWSGVTAHLVERFHVIAYDTRGAGASGAPANQAGYDLERLVDDALAVIDALAPDRPVHLVGHDWGSIAGWEMATSPRMAGRLASFTSVSGPCLDHVGHWMRHSLTRPTPARLSAVAGQLRRSWYIGAFRLPGAPLAWRTVIGRQWPAILTRLEGPATGEGHPTSTVGQDRARGPATGEGHPASTVGQDGARGVGLYRANVARRLRSPRPEPVAHVPVQLVIPTRDPFISPRFYDAVAQWAPALRRRRLDAGHWVPRSRPEPLARWIGELVDDLEKPTPAGRRLRARQQDTRPHAGRLALVTGAGSGIGRATALALARAGAEVIAVDIDGDAAARTSAEAGGLGAPAASFAVDVSDGPAMERLAKTVAAEHGVVDVLVNNAGIAISGPFLDTTVDDWRRVLDVNLWGVIHGCRAFAAQMVERGEGGHIVNVTSAAAFQASRELPAYCTSKAAVLMLSQCLHGELASRGIGVSAVCPGFIATNITQVMHFAGRSEEEEARLREKSTALYRRRNYTPERVAEDILRAVAAGTAVLPVAPEARALYALSRFAPGLSRRLGSIDPGRFM
jgi:NAD(P)-dependent dehydrogenase (short-subunit alcohol dehydrogenase family)/pimeloyl-ACP methyl ester carboxylesterase